MNENNKFVNALNNPLSNKGIYNTNLTLTENDALTFKSTGHAVLDFFSKSGALRGHFNEWATLFEEAFNENPLLAMKALFYNRDVRGGQGERDLFRYGLRLLAENAPDALLKNLHLVPEYGRWDDLWVFWDDLWVFLDTKFLGAVIELVKNQLRADFESDASLLAKWMPSANAGKKSRKLAKIFIRELGVTEETYRKVLSQLRAELKIVEKYMSSGNWSEIDYSAVPSQAFKLYRKAFAKRDGERFATFLEAVQAKHDGVETTEKVKINTGAISPVQLAGVYLKEYNYGRYSKPALDQAVELQWKELPQYVLKGNVLAIIDTSSSMLGDNAINTAIALGLVTAEQNSGAFAGVAISFSHRPQWFTNLGSDRTLRDRAWDIASHAEVADTDFEATQRLILEHAIKHNVPQEDMPRLLVAISDMQFNSGTTNYTHTTHEVVKAAYRKAGYNLPVMVYWNVRASVGQPVLKSEIGTILVSGDSMGVFKSVASADLDPQKMTPEYFMLQVLESERYAPITI